MSTRLPRPLRHFLYCFVPCSSVGLFCFAVAFFFPEHESDPNPVSAIGMLMLLGVVSFIGQLPLRLFYMDRVFPLKQFAWFSLANWLLIGLFWGTVAALLALRRRVR